MDLPNFKVLWGIALIGLSLLYAIEGDAAYASFYMGLAIAYTSFYIGLAITNNNAYRDEV